MNETNERPTFIDAWLRDLYDDYKRYGFRKLIPIKFLSCLTVGLSAGAFVPKPDFWDKPEISLVFFTAIITLDGLLLALAWTSFGKIYELASAPGFSAYLREKGLLNSYFFFVDYIHATQIAALSFAGIGLVVSVYKGMLFPHIFYFFIFSFCIASTIYAVTYALGAVRIMQDLTWNRGVYAQLLKNGNNVRPIRSS